MFSEPAHGRRESPWRVVALVSFAVFGTAASAVQNSVVVWGGGSVTNVPVSVTNVASVVTSRGCVAVGRDGRLHAWGDSRMSLPPSATNAVAVSIGPSPLVLRRDGSVVSSRPVPREVSNCVAVIAGVDRYWDPLGAGALRRDGVFLAWDRLAYPTNNNTPNVVAIAGGGSSLADVLYSDGTVGSDGGSSSSTNVVALARLANTRVWLKSDGTVESFPTNAPPGLSNVVAVAAGADHGLALKGDGTVVAWGGNAYGQTDVPVELTGVAAIAAGYWHNLALKADGTVVAWGRNSSGQTDVPASLANVAAVFAEAGFSVAIVGPSPPSLLSQPPDETVWAGLPATFTVNAAGTPPLGFQWQVNGEIIEGATNSFHRIARTTAGHAGLYSVLVSNARGTAPSRESQLIVRPNPGILLQPRGQTCLFGGSTSLRVTVEGQGPAGYQWFFDGTALDGATQSSLGLSNLSPAGAGDYWCVVTNAFGGITSSVARISVVLPLQPTNQVAWVSGSAIFTTTNAGTEPITFQWCSQDGPVAGATGPVLELTNLSFSQAGDYWAVADAAFGSCTSAVVRLSVNGIATWGNSYGYAVPASLQGATVAAIGAGWYHYFARRGDGTPLVWGRYDLGGGGVGQPTVPPGLTNIVALAGGTAHSLALLADGTVAVWGNPYYGIPNIPRELSNAVAVAAGTLHCLVLGVDGQVWAWGDNYYGETSLPADLDQVVSISALGFFSLALRADGTVVAWGLNDHGQTNVPVGLSGVVAIAAGSDHSVALRADGGVVAWGGNQYGQTNVPAGLSDVVAIAAGFYHNLALRSDGIVVAWGYNNYGQADVPASLSNVVAIATGGYYNLAIVSAGLAAAPVQVSTPLRSEGTFSLQVPSLRGKNYYLQYRDALGNPGWTLLPPMPGDGTVKTLTDERATVPQCFYRVWQKP